MATVYPARFFNEGGIPMKAISKVLLVGAIAVMAIAVSAAPSEAKKHHKMMKGPKAGTYAGQVCSMGCNKKTNACKVMMWGTNNKWAAASMPTCTFAGLPAGLLGRANTDPMSARNPSRSAGVAGAFFALLPWFDRSGQGP